MQRCNIAEFLQLYPLQPRNEPISALCVRTVPASIFALQRASYAARRGMFPLHILATCPQVCVDLKSLYVCDFNLKFEIYINVNKLKTKIDDSEGSSQLLHTNIVFCF